ncbi:unnamed protein product [Ectocarpus fasciculatus]
MSSSCRTPPASHSVQPSRVSLRLDRCAAGRPRMCVQAAVCTAVGVYVHNTCTAIIVTLLCVFSAGRVQQDRRVHARPEEPSNSRGTHTQHTRVHTRVLLDFSMHFQQQQKQRTTCFQSTFPITGITPFQYRIFGQKSFDFSINVRPKSLDFSIEISDEISISLFSGLCWLKPQLGNWGMLLSR